MKAVWKSGDTDLLDKNFGLTETEFEEMVEQLHAGEDEIYRRVFLSHFDYCMNYLKKQFGVSHEDAYDATMDALLEFCHRLRAGKIEYGNLRYLFTRISGQRLHRERKERTAGREEGNLTELVEEVDVGTEVLEEFSKVWHRFGEPCKTLLYRFYYDRTSLKAISLELNRSEVAIRKQKQRCLEKLQTLVRNQLNDL